MNYRSLVMRASAVCLCILLAALAPAQETTARWGAVFHPGDFEAIGSLTPESGATVMIDTDTPSMQWNAEGLKMGVVGKSGSGRSEAAVFCFESIDIPSGVTFDIKGSRPLALLSKGDASIGASISVSAQRAKPGPGGFAGVRSGQVQSDPLEQGPGAGMAPASGNGMGGTGGSFGGKGGAGGSHPTMKKLNQNRGGLYGDDAAPLTEIIGGSAGGPGDWWNKQPPQGQSGAGGGAIQIVAMGKLNVAMGVTISADGGDAQDKNWVAYGAGSGGMIVLAAETIANQGTLSVQGGDTMVEKNPTSAGGGGGGRVYLFCKQLEEQGEIVLSGGKSNNGADAVNPGTDGEDGVLVIEQVFFPEN